MIRLAKLTDYGLVIMAMIARLDSMHARLAADPLQHTARDLAHASRLGVSTVSKLLKSLQQHGLLVSHRGVKGGYTLARGPETISIAEIITALEGSIALTECSRGPRGACSIEGTCTIRANQQIINEVVRGALERVTLSDLVQPMRLVTIRTSAGERIPAIGYVSGRTQ